MATISYKKMLGTATCTITFTYTVTEDNTKKTVSVSKYKASPITGGSSSDIVGMATWASLSHKLVFDGTAIGSGKDSDTSTTISGSKYVTKTHSAQTKVLAIQTGSTTEKTVNISVSAKPSYTVSYNANSGSGQPSNQTKWYGETLTLSTAKPAKSGYTFRGWATSTANAGTNTTVTTYTGNAAAIFYAAWELNYSKPSITNLKVERCKADGSADDEGAYAKVSFNWSVFRSSAARYYGGSTAPYSSNSVDACTVTVGSSSITPTLSGASGTYSGIVGDGSFGTDSQYAATVTISDTQTIQSAKTTTVNGTLAKAKYPLDFNADGTAVGILTPAPDNADGVFIGDKVTHYGDIVINGSGFPIQVNNDTASSNTFIRANRTDQNPVVGVSLGVGNGGENHGIYSNRFEKWIIYADVNGVIKDGSHNAITNKSMFASGHETYSSIATNSYADKSVSFGKTFASAPNVVACLSTSGTAGNIGNVSVSVFNITTTGCTVRVFNNRGSALSPAIEWIAVGI